MDRIVVVDSALRGRAKMMAILTNPFSDVMRKAQTEGSLEERERIFWHQLQFDRPNVKNQILFSFSLPEVEKVVYWSATLKVNYC